MLYKPATLFLFVTFSCAQAQDAGNGDIKTNVRKTERRVKKEIRHVRKGIRVQNGAYTSFVPALDSVVARLSRRNGIEAAAWDKCATKIAIYPGHSTIGLKIKTGKGTAEKCFLVQEGKTRKINRWLGWLHYFKEKNRLIYQGMSDCAGFTEQQKEQCSDRKHKH